ALMPGDKKKAKDKTAEAAAGPTVRVTDASATNTAPPKPPVDVACAGPFTFDFVRYVASFDHDVTLVQNNLNGPSDQLSCMRLAVHFAPKPQANPTAQPIVLDPGKRQNRDLGQLEAVAVVAEGHPAVINSPSQNTNARGDRIQIAIRERRYRITGGSDTMLVR